MILPESVLSAIDPGVKDIVVDLNKRGWTTTDSGDGVSKPPDERIFHSRHVAVVANISTMVMDSFKLLKDLVDLEPGVSWMVESNFSPNDGAALHLAHVFSEDEGFLIGPKKWPGEFCKKCFHRNVIGFKVDDVVWEKVTQGNYSVLCPTCFDELADQAEVPYEFHEMFPTTWNAWVED